MVEIDYIAERTSKEGGFSTALESSLFINGSELPTMKGSCRKRHVPTLYVYRYNIYPRLVYYTLYNTLVL